MRLIITDRFSLSMLDREIQKGTGGRFSFRAPARTPQPVVDTAKAVWTINDCRANGAEIVSAVGDDAAAAVLGNALLSRRLDPVHPSSRGPLGAK